MPSIILIGYMGSGKSTIAKKLASRLDFELIDTDNVIEIQQGKNITQIFEQHGESYFRELEKQFIETLDFSKNYVLSTGGGMPCHNNLMHLLKENGITIYLKRSVFELAFRLKNAKKKRPLVANLKDDALLDYITKSLSDREQFYNQAHFIIDSKTSSVNKILELINFPESHYQK